MTDREMLETKYGPFDGWTWVRLQGDVLGWSDDHGIEIAALADHCGAPIDNLICASVREYERDAAANEAIWRDAGAPCVGNATALSLEKKLHAPIHRGASYI